MKKQTKWVDFRSLKNQVNVLDVMKHFGVELNSQNEIQYYGPCPMPGHAGDRTNPNAFSMNVEKNAWRCLTHCGSGNVIDLHVRMDNGDPGNKGVFRETALAMQEIFLGGEATMPSSPAMRPKVSRPTKLEPNEQLKFSLNVKSDIPYLTKEKKFDSDFLSSLGIGWVGKGMFSGRVVVPIHNRKAQLVGYAGRGLKEADIQKRGRWLLPKDFHKSLELFNQHRASKCDIDQYGLVVVEGFWSTLRWHQTGFIPVVGLMGSSLSEAQLERIAELASGSRVWLMLDNDEAGQKAREKAVLQLAEKVAVRLVNYPDESPHTQPEEFAPEELLQLLPV